MKKYVLWSQGREELIDGEIKEKVQGARRQGIKCKQLLDELKASSRYLNLKKQETLDCHVWRTRF